MSLLAANQRVAGRWVAGHGGYGQFGTEALVSARSMFASSKSAAPSGHFLRMPDVSMNQVMSTPTTQASKSTGTLDVPDWLGTQIASALVEAFGPEYADTDPMITLSTKPEFGDYQCNVAMSLAKKLKSKPRDVAENICEKLQVEDVFEPPEIAGPGFLNLRLKKEFFQKQLHMMFVDKERCAVAAATPPQRVVVDYSSPNIAKEMHAGHLRSTIIGDTLSRILEFRGHDVLRLNHVGDWGTQFGMLITHLSEQAPKALTGEETLDISDLVTFYKAAKVRFDSDTAFQTQAREEVVKLQAGDERALRAWQMLCKQSEVAFQKVYDLLMVDPRLEIRGESFYNPQLPGVIERLRSKGMLEESDGATCVFLEGYIGRDGTRQPTIVQKSDGGFMYSTTDLAAVAQRVNDERADRMLYVTDAGQKTHFDQIFEISRLSSVAPDHVSLEHVPFGLVLGEDGQKFKTRSGETVKLIDLLDEAVSRATSELQSRLETENRSETEEFVGQVAQAVGIGAVKYADLAMNRNSNYRFSYDKMLSLQGNTAPYMMYAYARIRGIQRKAIEKLKESGADTDTMLGSAEDFILETESEVVLSRHLFRFADVVRNVERDLLPSTLCAYIFELSSKFNQFYENCPVLGSSDALRTSRLALCELSASVLKLSLGLLGIPVLERF
jgi:arginyl-tRNA synthetase